MVVRVGDRLLATMPAEPTLEVGRRVREAVTTAAEGTGIGRVIVVGYTNEYLSYLTTPEEYERQHYEGGSTLYGPYASVLLTDALAELAARMASGDPAQDPYPFDPRNGVIADGEPFPDGAEGATAESQPARKVSRPGLAYFAWRGGPKGFDRPLDRAFVVVQRRGRNGHWRKVTNDLGTAIVWRLDDTNRYTANWTVPRKARAGRHRFKVKARQYRLKSKRFRVSGRR